MRFFLFFCLLLVSVNGNSATECQADDYLKGQEGQDKLSTLVERSKSLIISRLEDFGISDPQLEVKSVLPKSLDDSKAEFVVTIKSKNLEIQKAAFKIKKANHEDDCGIEVIINGGTLIDKENGKNFGKLGSIKEFIKIN